MSTSRAKPNAKRKNSTPLKSSQDGITAAVATPTPIANTYYQSILEIYNATTCQVLGPDLADAIQTVKGHLYRREFREAWGTDAYRRAYAARWSPGRALAYLRVLFDLETYLGPALGAIGSKETEKKLVCVGGGGGPEVVALRTWQRLQDAGVAQVIITVLDMAEWESVITELAGFEHSPKEKSSVTCLQADILELAPDVFSKLFNGASLVTINFTLNELYTMNMRQTQRVLLALTHCLDIGSLLLVVDSAGSYATVTINENPKKYPMQWLLDHTLLETASDEHGSRWKKLATNDSVWFRIPAGLRYPIGLEDMRYQVHLFERV